MQAMYPIRGVAFERLFLPGRLFFQSTNFPDSDNSVGELSLDHQHTTQGLDVFSESGDVNVAAAFQLGYGCLPLFGPDFCQQIG